MVKNIFTFVLSVLLSNPSYAEEFDFKTALNRCTELKLKLPKQETDGRIQTLNKKGAMSPVLDEATLDFIEFGKDKRVLEIGGAYGSVMEKMLSKHPGTTYHLNDLDSHHLYIAAQKLSFSNIPPKFLANAKFISGDASEIDTKDQYDAILVARVLHFMDPEKLNNTVTKIFGLLKPGGRVFVVAITPYVKRYKSFIKVYEERLAKGDAYPGYVNSLAPFLNKEVTDPKQQTAISEGPFMFLDTTVLSREFEAQNFKIIKCKMTSLGYQSESWSLDGRENVIMVAQKPE